ncbi:hypothetical protein A9995_10425 [Erythrobacter sp. QSSC1-22B]|uniref:DUF6692 family protein n=1 Tax=Erythrobacter sp. QSSC1-22B TaxID=1860125 RepID=UPI0008057816|nr:DUF6692 family protein [Erythrobacter sp. QSSC1-22B]OBX18946.1 hypothetical protein A9995_10425 [Erythrobacter sp. QSSC1-22B]
MKTNFFLIAGLTATLAACNQNTAIGNDREARLDPPAEASPIEPASSALQNVATALVKPETMSAADIAAIGGTSGRCVYSLTEVGFPTVVYEPGAQAFVKLNGKLIPMQAAGRDRYVSGELLLTMRTLDDEGNAGLQSQEIVIVPPGAEDELGYRGYINCEN